MTTDHVGTGSSVTIRELAETIVDITDTDSEITYTAGRDADIRHSEADIMAAMTELGYEPTVSLRDSLERTVAWIREH